MPTIWSEQASIWDPSIVLRKTNRPLEMFSDTNFENGFAVYGPRHEDGMIAQYAGVSDTTGRQAWNIAQWAVYRHPLTAETRRIDLPGGGFVYETPTMNLSVHDSDEYLIRMEQRAEQEYRGHVRKFGEEWPHFLLEQHAVIDCEPALGELNALEYEVSFRLNYSKCNMRREDMSFDNMHHAQVTHYWAIADIKMMDWFWFGLNFYDSRYDSFPGYLHIDEGKADASNKMIVVEPQKTFSDQKAADGEWMDIRVDILPLIKKAVCLAKTKGCLSNSRFEDMKIVSTNLGFEMMGNFDAAFMLRKLRLTGK